MKPLTPHDPLDDLIAAALHGDLTPEERAQFDVRLQTDPAAQAAYRKAQAMHDLLEKTHQQAQPDAAFEQRMVSGVRRKMQTKKHRETAWESILALWRGMKAFFARKREPIPYFGAAILVTFVCLILAGTALGPITNGIKAAKQSSEMQEAHAKALADYQAQVDAGVPNPQLKDLREFLPPDYASNQSQVRSVFTTITSQLAMAGSSGMPADAENGIANPAAPSAPSSTTINTRLDHLTKLETHLQQELASDATNQNAARQLARVDEQKKSLQRELKQQGINYTETAQKGMTMSGYVDNSYTQQFAGKSALFGSATVSLGATTVNVGTLDYKEPGTSTTPQGGTIRGAGFDIPGATPQVPTQTLAENTPRKELLLTQNQAEDDKEKALEKNVAADSAPTADAPKPAATPPAIDDRKLIRNAQLDLEVKSFQDAMDQITALTKSAGGYVDTSNSQKGGNGKLQGTVVVKILPPNLDDFLFKLRDLGVVRNQSVSTDDVTKDYFDTQARLVNSQKMELQLQDLLKRENGKVADLLAVERELARVRGDIEQMQGQLKLYDFQVQYATVTMNLSEKDLNQAAAYLLKEQDDFSLFATDVEATFQKARQAADDFKAQVLTANLNHNSGTDVSAELEVMVAPDQIEPFLAQVRSLGRVANFTRQTQRVAKDGGDSTQPADETKTEKDKVQVHLTIRSDDETRKQVALTVVAKAVDAALDQAKAAALVNAGTDILNSSLNKTPQGQSTAQVTVRVPGKEYAALMAAYQALGRTSSLSIQRNDDSGPGANGDDAPVIVSLALTDDDAPMQQTDLSVAASDVDQESQQIKKTAGDSGVEVKASSFSRQPDGSELAQMTFRVTMAKYPAFLESVKALGKVESLTVQRNDRPDETRTDDNAPAEINLQLHNQRDIIADDAGFWATMRQTFGEGAGALFTSVRVIGVIVAFLVPWVVTLGVTAWVGRRIYIWRKR